MSNKPKYDKLKPSRHYKDRLADPKKPGHNLPVGDEMKEIVDNPEVFEQQDDERVTFWGNGFRVITSAFSSAGTMIGRVVTSHRDRKTPKS